MIRTWTVLFILFALFIELINPSSPFVRRSAKSSVPALVNAPTAAIESQGYSDEEDQSLRKKKRKTQKRIIIESLESTQDAVCEAPTFFELQEFELSSALKIDPHLQVVLDTPDRPPIA